MYRFVPILVGLFVLPADTYAQVTYAKEISRLLQARCQQCHHDGDIAPFSLTDYESAVTWSRDIYAYVSTGQMPPWKPVPGFGDFRDSRALTAVEKQMLLDWIDNGMPEGDPADLPAPLQFSGAWPLGQPDIVLQMAQRYTPPIGTDVYRCFVIPSGITANTDMTAIDLMPGNRQIVHHVIIYQDTSGQAQLLDGVDGQPGYTCFGGPGIDLSFSTSILAGWAPGQRSSFLPDGIGIQVQGGATLIMQVHYSPSAVTGPDLTQIGLYRATKPVQQHLYQIPLVNQTFTIPAGAQNYKVTASLTVPPLLDGKAIEIYPHMHLLGQQIQVNVTTPGGATVPMIYEDAWDFRWQGYYTYTSPIALKAGSTARLTCTYDNSDNNPSNPNNPLVPVSFGENTSDEMCIALVGVTFDNEKFLPLNFERRMTQH